MTDTDNLMADPWPREVLYAASRMWIDGGLSAGKIAAAIGKSRNAVSGMAHRNRNLFPQRRAPSGGRGHYKKKEPHEKTRPPGWRAPKKSPTGPVARVVGNWTEGAGDRKPPLATMPFAQIPRGRCKFPTPNTDANCGPDMLCCGMPAMDRYALPGDRKASNCEMHFRIGNSVSRVTNRA